MKNREIKNVWDHEYMDKAKRGVSSVTRNGIDQRHEEIKILERV